MRKATILLGLLAGVTGCAGAVGHYDGPADPMPQQELAQQVVWHGVFGWASGDLGISPPPVVWRHDAERVFVNADSGHVVEGAYHEDPSHVELEWFGSFSASPYAHELAHVTSLWLTGDAEDGHDGPYFSPGGKVDQANAALRAHGL